MTIWLYIHTKQERDTNIIEENFICTRRKFGFNKKIRTKLTFPPQQQKNDTTAQWYCTLSTYVTPKTISQQNKKN